MRVSKSTNVCGYVKAALKYKALAAKIQGKEEALEPLRRKVTEALADREKRRLKLTGGQFQEAIRILAGTAEGVNFFLQHPAAT